MGAKAATALTPAITLPSKGKDPAWLSSAAIVAVDLLTLSVIYWIAFLARSVVAPVNVKFYTGVFPGIVFFLAAFASNGLYPGILLHPAEEIRRVLHSVTAVFILAAWAAYLWHTPHSYSREIFFFAWAACTPMVLLGRHLARQIFAKRSWWGVPAVVLGSGPTAARVLQLLADKRLGIKVKGVLTEYPPQAWPSDLPPVLGTFQSAPFVAAAGFAQYAILAMAPKTSADFPRIIKDCCYGFRHVLILPDMAGVCSLGIAAREIGGELGFELPQPLFHRTSAIAKRLLDLLSSLLALALLSPLLVFVSLAVKLTSRGPIFFGHLRYGREGKTFKAWKFRTMVQNSDVVLKHYLEQHPELRAEWLRDHKLKNDPRVTAVGKLLRRYSIDEIPQLWNVLRGEMSLVGPRPIVTAEIAKYGRGYELYMRVVPGITGLWQVSGRNNTTYEERVAFDEYYVANWSIWLDAYILFRTVPVVLTAKGAY